MIGTLAGQMIY